MLITNQKYQELYHKEHEKGHFQGFQVMKYKDAIGALVRETNARTLLDYGCGKGLGYTVEKVHKEWDVSMPLLYDPYFPPYNKRPLGMFNGVICLDVLEHVPEGDVPDVLADIFSYVDKFALITIDLHPARKVLDNGENAHVTLKPHKWWEDQINKANTKNIKAVIIFEDREKTNG